MLKKILFLIILLILSVRPAFAVSDPRLFPNNKFGINILSPQAEMEDAATLVNHKGDWGYIVLTLTRSQRDTGEIQNILNLANQNHLIPIIRLATQFDSKKGYWQAATDEDAKQWADFLSKLYFPTKNKFVQAYNEVNSASEWGGKVDGADYAKQLSNTIDALKAKDNDFFILNAPLDLSIPNSKNSEDAASFFADMNFAVPGIFERIDGLASHSYPNPNFSGSPSDLGKTGISGFSWELSQISKYSSKGLPVFITETGWKRAVPGKSGLTEDQIAQYYVQAFSGVWNDSRIVAVAPFLLSYPEPLFNQFAFMEDGSSIIKRYYKYFSAVSDLPKIKGEPLRQDILSNLKINKADYLIRNIGSNLDLEFKNSGNYIWNTNSQLRVDVFGPDIIVGKTSWDSQTVYPGQNVNAGISVKSIVAGTIPLLWIYKNGSQILVKTETTVRSETAISFIQIKVKSASAALKDVLKNIPKIF